MAGDMQISPVLAGIFAEEAEAFVAAACIIRRLSTQSLVWLAPEFRVPMHDHGEKGRRKAILAILRRWKEPVCREQSLRLVAHSSISGYPAPADQADEWTDQRFAQAYEQGLNVLWLAWIRRYIGRGDGLKEWLSSLHPAAERWYWVWVAIGRRTLQQLVYPNPADEPAPAALEELAGELEVRDRRSQLMRRDIRQLEQTRKRLKMQALIQERSLLERARIEAGSARAALREQLAAYSDELAREAARYQEQLEALRKQIEAMRERFIRELSGLAARPRAPVLRASRVRVIGDPEHQDVHNLIIRALGGLPSARKGALTVETLRDEGFAPLARRIRQLVPVRVVMTCDGLYRRKGRRHGIAVAGCEVRWGGRLVHRQTKVVCCGPLAGSLMAEYGAVVMALAWLNSTELTGVRDVEIRSDCKTLIRRLQAREDVRRKPGCVQLHSVSLRLLSRLRRHCPVRLSWVPRERNTAVDRLCARSYWNLDWYHRPPVKGQSGQPLREFLNQVGGQPAKTAASAAASPAGKTLAAR